MNTDQHQVTAESQTRSTY